MTDRLIGELPDLHDMGEARTVTDLVQRHLGPIAGAYDAAAIEAAFVAAVNERLDGTGLYLEDDHVYADGRVDADIRELLDDAVFTADLAVIAEQHRR